QNTEGRAHEAFGRAIFPEGQPNRPHSIAEYLAAAKVATLDDVKAFHAKYYGPAHLTLVLAGDVSNVRAADEVAKAFSGWSGGRDYLAAAGTAAERAEGARDFKVPLEDKTSVSVIIGQ